MADQLEKDFDELIFENESVNETQGNNNKKSWKIMIVDDEEQVHSVTKMVLADFFYNGYGLEFISAYSSEEAKTLISENPDIAVILLDVVMETNEAGLELAKYIRNNLNDKFVRIILRTGQPGEAPEREVITSYDINDYKLKTLLTDQSLFTTVVTAIRSYEALIEIENNRIQLEKALEEAEIAIKAKNQFLSNMHHELKTPLTGILGLSNVLLRDKDSEKNKEYYMMIMKSGQTLLKIINNILELVGIEQGKFILKNSPFSLRDILDEIIDIVEVHAHLKNLKIEFIVNDNVNDELVGDSKRLKQILMNIIVNAIKCTEKGSIYINVSLLDDALKDKLYKNIKDDSSIYILFAIKDTGVGIPAEKHETIFKPFQLGEDHITKKFGGAGLGLSIAKEIIEKMNGTIWLDSEPEKGSTFYFSIKFEIFKN